MVRYSVEIAKPMATPGLSVLITRVLNVGKITHPSHARNSQVFQQNVPLRFQKEYTLTTVKDVKYTKTEPQISIKTRQEPHPSNHF